MGLLLVLGLFVSIIATFDVLVAVFGADTRPDFGTGHTILG